jgi:pilus assembly protein Flp/PilA
MKNLFSRFVRDEQGQDLIEYALLASFVAVVAIGGATILGNGLSAWFTLLGNTINGFAA